MGDAGEQRALVGRTDLQTPPHRPRGVRRGLGAASQGSHGAQGLGAVQGAQGRGPWGPRGPRGLGSGSVLVTWVLDARPPACALVPQGNAGPVSHAVLGPCPCCPSAPPAIRLWGRCVQKSRGLSFAPCWPATGLTGCPRQARQPL